MDSVMLPSFTCFHKVLRSVGRRIKFEYPGASISRIGCENKVALRSEEREAWRGEIKMLNGFLMGREGVVSAA